MNRPVQLISGLMRLTLWVAAAAILLIALFTFYDVLMRYLWNSPTVWVTEITIYMLQFLVFIPAGMLVIEGSHLRVTVWIESLSGRARRAAESVSTALILPYAAVLVWYGWSYTQRALDRDILSPTLLQVPMWIIYMMIPAGGILMIVGALVKCTAELLGHSRKEAAE